MTAVEVNFDSIIGPTHNYSGLSFGNVASEHNARQVSNPRQAALQGLEKMWALAQLGLKQAVLPPHPRPQLDALRNIGFTGSDEAVIAQAYREAPVLLSHAYSSSFMWAANAGTVSPSADTADGKLHITPANLVTNFHRSLEPAYTSQLLRHIFADEKYFACHPPLPATPMFADEGAANHMRLCEHHGQAGVECFVYGRAGEETATRRYPARQSREASEAIARLHGLDTKRTVFIRQHPQAIDAGVFHNDVIATANENVLLYHELAFAEPQAALAELRKKCNFDLCLIEITNRDVPLEVAVKSYLFNSQLVTLPEGGMALIAPVECREAPQVKAAIERMIAANDNPLQSVHYLDVRESMKNGGGPACLRLRVVMTEKECAAVQPSIWLTAERYETLKQAIAIHYPERISAADLGSTAFLQQVGAAHEAVHTLIC